VLGHVTKVEQQYAPYKSFVENNVNPQELEGLQNFAKAYQANPLQTWLNMARQLQEAKVIHEFLDLEEVQALAQGQEIDDGAVDPGAAGVETQGSNNPELNELRETVGQLVNYIQQQEQSRQQRQADGLLEQSLNQMKQTLTDAGFPEGVFNDQILTASIVTHKGDVAAAVQSLTGVRDGLLKGHVENNTSDSDLDMPHGVPPAPKKNTTPPRDGFAAARGPAMQRLAASARASAQE